MGRGRIYHHAGLFLFCPACLQFAALPGIGCHSAVDQVFILFCIIFQFAFGPDDLVFVAAAFCHHAAVADQGLRFAADRIARHGYANGCGSPRPAGCHIHNSCVIGEGIVAQGYYAYVPFALYIRVVQQGADIIFYQVIAAGTAYGSYAFSCYGRTCRHTRNRTGGGCADTQVPCIKGNLIRFMGIRNISRRSIPDPVPAHSHNACQDAVRPAHLYGCRSGADFRFTVCRHGHVGGSAAPGACYINPGIVQACTGQLVRLRVRHNDLRAQPGLLRNTDAHGNSGRAGCIGSFCADNRRFAVLFDSSDICVIDF